MIFFFFSHKVSSILICEQFHQNSVVKRTVTMGFWYYIVHKAPGLEKHIKKNLKFSIQFDFLIENNFLTEVNFSNKALYPLYLWLPN